MKVTKTTWLSVGRGTVEDIVKYLNESNIPDHAVVISVDSDGFDIQTGDSLLDRSVRTDAKLKFEWIDDE